MDFGLCPYPTVLHSEELQHLVVLEQALAAGALIGERPLGGVGALPLLDARLKAMKRGDGFFDWQSVTLAVLKKYGEEHAEKHEEKPSEDEPSAGEGAPARTYTGEWRAASQKTLLTARQNAAVL